MKRFDVSVTWVERQHPGTIVALFGLLPGALYAAALLVPVLLDHDARSFSWWLWGLPGTVLVVTPVVAFWVGAGLARVAKRRVALLLTVLSVLSWGVVEWVEPVGDHIRRARTPGVDIRAAQPFGPNNPISRELRRQHIIANPPAEYSRSTNSPLATPPNWLRATTTGSVAWFVLGGMGGMFGWAVTVLSRLRPVVDLPARLIIAFAFYGSISWGPLMTWHRSVGDSLTAADTWPAVAVLGFPALVLWYALRAVSTEERRRDHIRTLSIEHVTASTWGVVARRDVPELGIVAGQQVAFFEDDDNLLISPTALTPAQILAYGAAFDLLTPASRRLPRERDGAPQLRLVRDTESPSAG